jgi:RsiW-degrading membrane proteinase PrsW (M82 family)
MESPVGAALVSLLPVVLFLGGLVYLDSYKLVTFRSVLVAVGAGVAAALIAFVTARTVAGGSGVSPESYSRYVAPVLEECLKAAFPIWLLWKKRIGFLVDAAVYGFAVGTGFALVENVTYLFTVTETNPLLWLVRGLGTALMHGGVTAMVAILGRSVLERKSVAIGGAILPGLIGAIIIHSVFNHFFVSPVQSAFATVVGVPAVMAIVFRFSEKSTQEWLGVGFDTDQNLLEMITTGVLTETHVGQYLQTLQERFPSEVVADMLCLLRLQVELSIGAKAVMLMREAGFAPEPDPEVREKLAEMDFLERSIGKTGMLALHPFLPAGARNRWQLELVGSGG